MDIGVAAVSIPLYYRELLETQKGVLEKGLAAETARRAVAEERAQDVERSAASLSKEIKVTTRRVSLK